MCFMHCLQTRQLKMCIPIQNKEGSARCLFMNGAHAHTPSFATAIAITTVCVCVCVGLKCNTADGVAWWSTQGQSLEDGDILSVSCDEMPAGK